MSDDSTAPPHQPRNPLHGVTLEAMVQALVAHFGWPGLAEQIPVRCFSQNPSINSSLRFLRKTPWARDKVESLYLFGSSRISVGSVAGRTEAAHRRQSAVE